MRRTAITCPEHQECVCVFHTVPERDLGDRLKIKLPALYHEWLLALGEVAIAIQHSPAPNAVDKLLSAGVVEAARSVQERLDKLEAFTKSKRRWRKRYDRG